MSFAQKTAFNALKEMLVNFVFLDTTFLLGYADLAHQTVLLAQKMVDVFLARMAPIFHLQGAFLVRKIVLNATNSVYARNAKLDTTSITTNVRLVNKIVMFV